MLEWVSDITFTESQTRNSISCCGYLNHAGGGFTLRFCRRICLEATTVEIETLTPRLVSTVAWFLSERLDGLLLMLSEFY